MDRRELRFRVFVSSTFNDLKAERNALEWGVFPRLREYCQKHGGRFQAIDLRRGISEASFIMLGGCLRPTLVGELPMGHESAETETLPSRRLENHVSKMTLLAPTSAKIGGNRTPVKHKRTRFSRFIGRGIVRVVRLPRVIPWKSACKRDPRRRLIWTHPRHTIHPYTRPSKGSLFG